MKTIVHVEGHVLDMFAENFCLALIEVFPFLELEKYTISSRIRCALKIKGTAGTPLFDVISYGYDQDKQVILQVYPYKGTSSWYTIKCPAVNQIGKYDVVVDIDDGFLKVNIKSSDSPSVGFYIGEYYSFYSRLDVVSIKEASGKPLPLSVTLNPSPICGKMLIGKAILSGGVIREDVFYYNSNPKLAVGDVVAINEDKYVAYSSNILFKLLCHAGS